MLYHKGVVVVVDGVRLITLSTTTTTPARVGVEKGAGGERKRVSIKLSKGETFHMDIRGDDHP